MEVVRHGSTSSSWRPTILIAGLGGDAQPTPDILAAAGCRAVDLEADMEHEPAEHLYERAQGFRGSRAVDGRGLSAIQCWDGRRFVRAAPPFMCPSTGRTACTAAKSS